MNLTEALSKNGILEAKKKVKEYFQKIEKELKKIKK
jgi:preprotein translocase subunit SecE